MAASEKQLVVPVILAGGKGTRLWPLSVPTQPKQFLSLTNSYSLLQQTLLRCEALKVQKTVVVGNFEHRFLLGEQVQAVGLAEKTDILLEPIARDSALPLALSCLQTLKQGIDPVLCVMPADAAILDDEGWLKALNCAIDAAATGYLTVIGLKPTRPETGYGYIEAGDPLSCAGDTFKVTSFKEKPDLNKAKEFIQDTRYLWNSGMFVVQASVLKKAFEDYAPATIKAAEEALNRSEEDLDFIRLDTKSFEKAPSISFDYAVMEHIKKAAVVKANFGWTDLGNWKAVKDLSDKAPNDNVIDGFGYIQKGQNNYIRSKDQFVAINGLSNIGVIATESAILVSDMEQIQDIKDLAKEFDKSGFHYSRTKVLRPWGSYESLVIADGYQVKRITVKPKKRLSLQKHKKRSEHWVVISGQANITLGEKEFLASENESIDIPLGCIHRLENPSEERDLILIEIQSGSYLGEDDIIRLADDFKRI